MTVIVGTRLFPNKKSIFRWWTILNPLKALQYHVCDLTALICLATIVADSSFPALQRLARLGLIQVSVVAATAMLVPRP